MLFTSKRTILGVDIGTTNIKIAQITTESATRTLDTYGLVDVPFEIDGTKESSIQSIAAVIVNLTKRSSVSTRKAVASLPNSAVFTSVIEMPPLTDQELKHAVEFEAKKYVPLPINEVTLSWTALDKSASGKDLVLITAVPNLILKAYTKIFSIANLNLIALDIEALALIRSVIGADKGNNLLIDVGAKATHFNITEKGNLVLTRSIPVGGETITTKISESLKISRARAEQFKKDFGINQASIIPETIKPILMDIKNEARQMINIYKARGKAFDKIIVVGGGANLPGLIEFFADLGPTAIHGNPLNLLTYSKELEPVLAKYAVNLAVAIGLALRTEE